MPIEDDDDPVKLELVRDALRSFHFSIDMRHNSGMSALHLVKQLETLLEMPYEQGAELARRSGRATDKGIQ